jgi:hypothetical protein
MAKEKFIKNFFLIACSLNSSTLDLSQFNPSPPCTMPFAHLFLVPYTLRFTFYALRFTLWLTFILKSAPHGQGKRKISKPQCEESTSSR